MTARDRTATSQTRLLSEATARVAWKDLAPDVRHAAKRHFVDSIAAMFSGADSDVVSKAEATIAALRPAGRVPVPGRRRRADVLDATYLGAIAAHAQELDDGYRRGSAHPGAVVVPAAVSVAHMTRARGEAVLEAIVAGYEAVTVLARAVHPALRRRGFHPTAAVGVFGASAAASRLLGLSPSETENAFGIAASSACGLFAFLNGGADVKRLHAGHAAREGVQAVLMSLHGIRGPLGIVEGPDGFAQAFADARELQSFRLPPDGPFGVTDCYIKPYACCRHLQPALEALIALLEENGLQEKDVVSIKVETYAIAAAHGSSGWSDYATAQLSFPYVMALGVRYRKVQPRHFEELIRRDAGIADLCRRVRVSIAPDLDARYPESRPARVTITTDRSRLTREVDEALGAPEYRLSDGQLSRKFHDLVEPILGLDRTEALLAVLWSLETCEDFAATLDASAE